MMTKEIKNVRHMVILTIFITLSNFNNKLAMLPKSFCKLISVTYSFFLCEEKNYATRSKNASL